MTTDKKKKKNDKPQKDEPSSTDHENDTDDNVQEVEQAMSALSTTTTDVVAAMNQIQSAQEQEIRRLQRRGIVTDGGDYAKKQHAFWDTQPMPHERMMAMVGENAAAASAVRALPASTTDASSSSSLQQHCPVAPDKPRDQIRAEPYNMPPGFCWSDIDITDETQLAEVYELLAKNYVEDDDASFRFDYSAAFLTWALTPPGFSKEFHVGVRAEKSNRLMALITGVPARVRAYHVPKSMVEINFLCVHKKLRSKRLAPVLIKEVTRRVNLHGIFQAVYTAGVVLPVPVASCRYYHRSLDIKKLIEVGFSRLHPHMTMARMQKLYRVPVATATPGLRAMTTDDVPQACQLLNDHLQKYQLAVVFSPAEFAHWLLPRPGVIDSYVACNDRGEVTDLCSFYHLPSTVMGNALHSQLRAAYSFYNVATSVSLEQLMKDCLVLAKRQDQDVFNALNLMDNDQFLESLKFGVGDGNLQYYLYNWACPAMESKNVGIVLL